jgi:UDP-N-acetyl-D-mannosaminuronate dehydrogenase
MDIIIFGMGYVGAVSAGCLALDGHNVMAVDVATNKICDLNCGRSPIIEPGPERLILESVEARMLSHRPRGRNADAWARPLRQGSGIAIASNSLAVTLIVAEAGLRSAGRL